MPSQAWSPSPPWPSEIRTTPTRPTPRPTMRVRPGRWRAIDPAAMAAKIGVLPLSIPVTAELMCCSASGKRVKGTATHTTDRPSNRGQSARSMRTRERGNTLSTVAPSATRAHVMRPGSIVSSAIEMNRNDDPQMSEIAVNSPQAAGVNAAWSASAAPDRPGVEVTRRSVRRSARPGTTPPPAASP